MFSNVFGGFKFNAYQMDGTEQGTDYEFTFSAYGLGIGVGGNYPISDSGFTLYGTFSTSYLMGKFEQNYPAFGSISDDVNYPMVSLELGCNYSLQQWVFIVSYRYQQNTIEVETQTGTTWEITENFAGPAFFVGYRF